MGVSKNNGTPKSSILIGFSIINHPFWGTPIFGNTHISTFQQFPTYMRLLFRWWTQCMKCHWTPCRDRRTKWQQRKTYRILPPITLHFRQAYGCIWRPKPGLKWKLDIAMIDFGQKAGSREQPERQTECDKGCLVSFWWHMVTNEVMTRHYSIIFIITVI